MGDLFQNLTLSTVGKVEDSFEGDLCPNLTLSTVEHERDLGGPGVYLPASELEV